MLVYNTRELEKYRQEPLILKQTLDVSANLKQRDPQIIEISPIQVQGALSLDGQFIFSDIHLTGSMTYPSTRSLEPVVLPIDFTFHETYTTLADNAITPEQKEQYDLIISLTDQTLDLQQAIEDNLLLNIPTQVLTPQEQATGVMPQGDEWTVISEDDYEQKATPNLEASEELSKLKDFFADDTHN